MSYVCIWSTNLQHQELTSLHSAAISWYREHLPDLISSEDNTLLLSLKQSVHIEHISSSLYLVVPKFAHALVCFCMTILAHVPAR